MACRSELKEIQGRTYTVTQMPPSMSLPIQMKLVQIASALAGPMLRDASPGSDGAGFAAFGDALGALGTVIAEHMPPEEFLAFAEKLTQSDYVSVEGAPILFESEFAGDDMTRLYPLLAFILEVNYAKFFGAIGLGKLLGLAKATFQKDSSNESPPT